MEGQQEPLAIRARRLRENFRREDGTTGLTQKELADSAGVSPTHVYQIERGLRKRMHLDTLQRYAKALGVSAHYLDVGYDEAPAGDGAWPDVAVTLRHTTALDEGQIGQVVRFVQALEAEQELAKLTESSSDVPISRPRRRRSRND